MRGGNEFSKESSENVPLGAPLTLTMVVVNTLNSEKAMSPAPYVGGVDSRVSAVISVVGIRPSDWPGYSDSRLWILWDVLWRYSVGLLVAQNVHGFHTRCANCRY